MSPFSSEPAIVEIQPSNRSTDIEGSKYRVELVRCPRDTCAVRDNGSGDNWSKQLCTVRKFEGFETAAEGIKENVSSGVELRYPAHCKPLVIEDALCIFTRKQGEESVLTASSESIL